MSPEGRDGAATGVEACAPSEAPRECLSEEHKRRAPEPQPGLGKG